MNWQLLDLLQPELGAVATRGPGQCTTGAILGLDGDGEGVCSVGCEDFEGLLMLDGT